MNLPPPLEDLVEAFLDAHREGNTPDIADYAARHPEHEARLLQLLPLLMDMESLDEDGKADRGRDALDFPDMAGTDFRLLKPIGRGGMGVVFEALQLSLQRKVAVKLLEPSLAADPEQRERFERESRVIAMLHHPNIMKVFAAGLSGEHCYYAMELADGESLDRQAFRDTRRIADIGWQAAKALAYAHSLHVLHRDIKPSNLFLDADGTVRVGDFGLAFVLRGEREVLEGDDRSGTLRYMAPERLARGVNSFQTDQYSLGATLYEMITRAPLLPERTAKSLSARIERGPLPPLVCAEPDLAAIINKSVSFDPDDRYESMDVFAEDLQRFLRREPVKARPAPFGRRFALWVRRKPALAATGFVASLAVLAFVIALAVGYRRTASALALAERNAAVADATLSRVFSHIEEQPPSRAGTELLSTLLPYYRNIVSQGHGSETDIAKANAVIGATALRAGDYSLAETAFRALTESGDHPAAMNRLAEALHGQGRTREANELRHRIAREFGRSESPRERLEAVRALQTLPPGADNAELERAFNIVGTLLRDDPANPDYRFLFAKILVDNPRLFRSIRIEGVEPNAHVLLTELADRHPDHPEYGAALLDLTAARFQRTQRLEPRDRDELAAMVNRSDTLLGRWPSDPALVAAAIKLRETYIQALRRSGDTAGARRETERLWGLLKIVARHPDAPDLAKEALINLQFQRLELAIRDGRSDEARRLTTDLRDELAAYDGEMSVDYNNWLTQMSTRFESASQGGAGGNSKK